MCYNFYSIRHLIVALKKKIFTYPLLTDKALFFYSTNGLSYCLQVKRKDLCSTWADDFFLIHVESVGQIAVPRYMITVLCHKTSFYESYKARRNVSWHCLVPIPSCGGSRRSVQGLPALVRLKARLCWGCYMITLITRRGRIHLKVELLFFYWNLFRNVNHTDVSIIDRPKAALRFVKRFLQSRVTHRR